MIVKWSDFLIAREKVARILIVKTGATDEIAHPPAARMNHALPLA